MVGRGEAIKLQRALEATFSPDETYRLHVMHLYRRALKGSLDRTGNMLMWRPEALAIRAQFESHRVQNTNVSRAKHLQFLEIIADNHSTPNPFIYPTAPDGSAWQRYLPRRTSTDLEHAARLAFTRNRDKEFAQLDKDWYDPESFEYPREEEVYGSPLHWTETDVFQIHPEYIERENRLIAHNRERALRRRELESRRPQQAKLPGWRADMGGILAAEGVTGPPQPESAQALPGAKGMPDHPEELEITHLKETAPAGYKKADEIIARIDRGELLDESLYPELKDIPTERLMDIRDALMDSMIEKRWALRDAIAKRQKLDKLIASGKSEEEARKELEAKGEFVESGNRVINRPLPGWQGLNLEPPKDNSGLAAGHH